MRFVASSNICWKFYKFGLSKVSSQLQDNILLKIENKAQHSTQTLPIVDEKNKTVRRYIIQLSSHHLIIFKHQGKFMVAVLKSVFIFFYDNGFWDGKSRCASRATWSASRVPWWASMAPWWASKVPWWVTRVPWWASERHSVPQAWHGAPPGHHGELSQHHGEPPLGHGEPP